MAMNAISTMRWRRGLLALAMALGLGLSTGLALTAGTAGDALAQTQGRDVPQEALTGGNVPGGSLGSASDSEMWRAVRGGIQGTVSIPDRNAGILVQSEGENWRNVRNGPLLVYGSWLLLGMIGVLALFFVLRGRIKIEAGRSGRTIERFGFLDRFAHWLTATSFIVLAITGINLLWGKFVLMPVLGPEAFAWLSTAGKYAHNFLAFPFMLGIVLMFVLWVRHNIPNKYDMIWLSKGGGLFTKHSHPPSKKFNAGQKLIFWATILGGLSLSLSGIALLFPFEFPVWSKTFVALNVLGLGLPTDLTPIQEMQLSSMWHAIVSLVLIAIIIAHIYIGSIGMQGAFAAMGSGKVDENWAREHHNLWVAEVRGETPQQAKQPLPAE
jgi:formate dehydrogenase subunit gamma